jgi:O-glycosyl hydrolase
MIKIKQAFLVTLVSFFAIESAYSQQAISIDLATKYQTMRGFGASDAWNFDVVGKSWSLVEKEKIAKLLFSSDTTAQGNPVGIGLSRWRFNLGAGSAEQGTASLITNPEHRTECFMTSFDPLTKVATYDWTKQAGQVWFLNKAKSYGVPTILAFTNSPPTFFTKNGRTNTDVDLVNANTNLKTGYEPYFALFLGNVFEHFKQEGINIDQISPINEPQYGWASASGQEGCPAKNEEAALLFREIDKVITQKNLGTKQFIGEAARWDYLYKAAADGKDVDKLDQIKDYFDPLRTNTYVGNLPSMEKGISSHSYWINNKNNATIKSYRDDAWTAAKPYNLELYQSEYNLLGQDFYDSYWLNTLSLCKLIQADLLYSNVSVWDYWTAAERERWGQRNRFFLLSLKNTAQGTNVHNYSDLTKAGGYVGVDKNLWAYGNFSRFIRPGYQRVNVTGAGNLDGLIGSAYISPDSKKVVAVYVNWGMADVSTATTLNGLPTGMAVKSITPYLTDSLSNGLTKMAVTTSLSYNVPKQSIVTLVYDLECVNDIVPYIKNGTAGWKADTSAVVLEGSSFIFGPQPFNGTWQWTGPNGFTSTIRNPSISSFGITNVGIYTATHTLGNCISVKRFHLTIPVISDVLSNAATTQGIYYSNEGQAVFKIGTAGGIKTLKIYTSEGQLIHETNMTDTEYKIPALPAAVYMLRVEENKEINYFKFIITQ